MKTDLSTGSEETVANTTVLELRVVTASREYKSKLQQKAAAMRAAVQGGETDDERVLIVAEALERLAENEG